MKLIIDIEKKTIEIDSPFKIKDLVEHLNEFLVNWEDYEIIPKLTNKEIKLPFNVIEDKGPKINEITKPFSYPDEWVSVSPLTIKYSLGTTCKKWL